MSCARWIIADHPPNIPKEMGVPAEWTHNKTGLAKKVGVAALIGGAVCALARMRRREK